MDLNYSTEELTFRDDVRSWLRSNLPAELKQKVESYQELSKDDLLGWHRILAKKGWVAPDWPVEWGGKDWTPLQRHIWREEMQLADVPEPLAFNASMIGPVIAAFGNEEQKKRFEAAKELGISLEDAETRLQQPGEMDAASRDALKEPIESLVAPVERARSILMSGETSQGRLDEVVLSGGGARLPGLGEAIERRLGTKVTVLDPLRAVAATAEVERSLAEYGGSSVLAVAVGLGLRGKE